MSDIPELQPIHNSTVRCQHGTKQSQCGYCMSMALEKAYRRLEAEQPNHTEHDVLEWVRETFGEAFLNQRERALRFIEEAIELAQACGLRGDDIRRLIEHVYARPLGEPAKEIGGVMITLEALGAFLDIKVKECSNREWQRIHLLPQSHFDAASDRKQRAGVCYVVGEGQPG